MKKEQQKPLTQAEVDAILSDWPADFSDRLLVGIRLEHLDLEGLNLRGATLRGCTFAHCKFDNAHFDGADLGDTKFIRCKMEYCFFDGAKQEDAAGLEHAIAEDNLVDMRRHERPDGYLDSFASCAQRMQEFMLGGMDSVNIHSNDESEDEDVEEGFDENFDEEPEQEFGGMTMEM